MGYNFYEIGSGGDEYLLVNGTHFPGVDAGKILIGDDGSNLMVKIEAKYDMFGSYVFVGSLFELDNFVLNKGCPNYHFFPYIKEWSTPVVKEWIFEIPIREAQKSYSFESVFGSNRWGWFSYCNF